MTDTYLSIILPIYNEETRLEACLTSLLAHLYDFTKEKFEILCVLNGCTDRSRQIAEGFWKDWPQVLVTESRKGKGAAVRFGMLMAHGEYRMMMDVDLATPPTEIPRFLNACIAYDVVAGRRQIHYDNPFRGLAHRAYKMLAAPLVSVSDPQCGFKMFRAECAKKVFEQVTITGWGFDVEALYLARLYGYRINEIPVPWEHHANGSKLHPVRDGIQMARDLLAIRKLHAA